MTSIPLLDDNDDQIHQSLSIQEIRIALTFLKKRFRDYTLKEIVHALSEYLLQKETLSMTVAVNRGTNMTMSRVPQGLFLHHRRQPVCHQDRSIKSQEIRLIAKLYCQSGINYSLAQYFYPQMTQKSYKSNLQLIAAQTINSIQKFLRYQCNVQIEQLSKLQKRSLRQKLINVRQWMGKTHPQHLKSYLLFIQRFYLCEQIEVEYKQALELYKVMLESVKGPEVIEQQGQQTNRGLRQQLRLSQRSERICTRQQENAIILLFKQLCSVQKVSDAMCQKYGYDIKWSIHSIKNILKRIYKAALKRLVETVGLYMKKRVNLWFGYGDEDVSMLNEYENSLSTKILLLDFYLLKKTTQLKLRQFVKKVNEFYMKNVNQDLQGFEMIPEDDVRLPVLVIEDDVIEMIEICQEDGEVREKKEQSKITDQRSERNQRKTRKDNRSIKKKRRWMEVVQLEESLNQEEEIFIFPNFSNGLIEKEAQEQTDVEDKAFQRQRKQAISTTVIKIQKITQEKETDQKKQKKSTNPKDTKDFKPKVIQVKQQQSLPPQQQPKIEKPALTKQPSSSIPSITKLRLLKKSKLNVSVDSIESEPVRLSLYSKNVDAENHVGRFKRKVLKKVEDDKIELQN